MTWSKPLRHWWTKSAANTANVITTNGTNESPDAYAIGRANDSGGAQWFPGRLDDVRVDDHVLNGLSLPVAATGQHGPHLMPTTDRRNLKNKMQVGEELFPCRAWGQSTQGTGVSVCPVHRNTLTSMSIRNHEPLTPDLRAAPWWSGRSQPETNFLPIMATFHSMIRSCEYGSGRRRIRLNRSRGFALVIALLGMASISLRGSEHEARMRVARTNARLAMELAIGQLQLEMGPDQRITTSAGILKAPAEGAQGGVAPRNWTGVWNAAASTSTDFDDGRPKAFRKWLVATAAEDSISAPDSDSRPMVEMQLDLGETTAEAPLIGAPGGRLGWLTSDESMKAPLDLAEQEAMSMGERVARNHAPDRTTPEIDPSLTALKSDPATAAKMVTLGQAELTGRGVFPRITPLGRRRCSATCATAG